MKGEVAEDAEGLKIRIDLRPSPGASRRPLPEGEAGFSAISFTPG